jgi:hypothetical protein
MRTPTPETPTRLPSSHRALSGSFLSPNRHARGCRESILSPLFAAHVHRVYRVHRARNLIELAAKGEAFTGLAPGRGSRTGSRGRSH